MKSPVFAGILSPSSIQTPCTELAPPGTVARVRGAPIGAPLRPDVTGRCALDVD